MASKLRLNYATMQTPINALSFAWGENEVLYFASFGDDIASAKALLEKSWGATVELNPAPLAPKIKIAMEEYFKGNFAPIDEIEVKMAGTAFQMKSWQALRTIPHGQTISYQEQAKRVGNIKAVRAIGGANHANPIPLVIPCHRVIGKNGKMVGFGGGIDVKVWLLEHERAHA